MLLEGENPELHVSLEDECLSVIRMGHSVDTQKAMNNSFSPRLFLVMFLSSCLTDHGAD